MTPDTLREEIEALLGEYYVCASDSHDDDHEEYWLCRSCFFPALLALIEREKRSAVEEGLRACHEITADFLAEKLIPISSQIDFLVIRRLFPSEGEHTQQ